jgi:adenine-specific DNA-methyltransferase
MARTPRSASRGAPPAPATVQDYRHAQEATARPEVGAAPRFRAKRETATYRYDSSLSPALEWDTNPARDTAAWLLSAIEDAAGLPGQVFPQPRELLGADGTVLLRVSGLQDALAALKRMQAPFLNWTGKAERLSFDVPTLPLFVHERLSTEAIVKTLEGHRKKRDAAAQEDMFSLFADPRMPMSQQVNAYAYRNGWVNRMILGDSLSVMNSLARYEGLSGQVQCIYMDPPYGVNYSSNFQPFVRNKTVSTHDDADLSREVEMVQAYRDTWSLGLHSYLTYVRDRLVVARDLLRPDGSIFVQISDENLHHMREVMDDIFGTDNFCALIPFRKKTMPLGTNFIEQMSDFLIWYAREKFDRTGRPRAKYRPLYRDMGYKPDSLFKYVELPSGGRTLARKVLQADGTLPSGARLYRLMSLEPSGEMKSGKFRPTFRGKEYDFPGNGYGVNPEGMARLIEANRIEPAGRLLNYVLFADDKAFGSLTAPWNDTIGADDKVYVVQTNTEVIQRCVLMTTDPGDLVLDPTCGAGTTAYVAEQWGRRWITIDTSRVPLALARQRLLTATFKWFKLKDESAGPSAGFVYSVRTDKQGRHVGGIIPHITVESIANNKPAGEIVLVDRPETDHDITRVSGPFVVEAVLPTPQPLDPTDPTTPPPEQDAPADHVARMIEILRRSPTLALPGGGKVTLKNIRRPGRSLNLSAEAMVDHDPAGGPVPLAAAVQAAHEANTNALPFAARPVAILIGPADGSVTARAVLEAAKEANIKNYAHLYVIGFGFTAEAQAELDAGEAVLGLPASRVTITMDVQMGDLLKTQRSSQIFAITGSPDIAVTRLEDAAEDGTPRWQVRLLGLDSFDPATMAAHHLAGDDVPMWMLDTGWNGMVFKAEQVFFPRTSAWDNLRRALKSTHDDSVWEHLRGAVSAPFAADAGTEIAVKVLDDRGNELMKIARLGS